MFTQKRRVLFFIVVLIFTHTFKTKAQIKKTNQSEEFKLSSILDDPALLANIETNQQLSIAISNNQFADANKPTFGISESAFKAILLEQKEIYDLSRELGINISNYDNLDLYREIATWLGIPYLYGGMKHDSVDCSGFTGLVFQSVYNKTLPRVSKKMAERYNRSISKDSLQVGDLVFFATQGKRQINHVGIYIGEDKFVHASSSRGVIVASLDNPYFIRAWRKGARVD